MCNLLAFSTSGPFIFILFICGVLIFIGVAYYWSPKQRLLRTLKKTTSQPVARIQNKAYAKIIGKAKHVKEPLTAPLSGRKCIFYQIKVERKGSKNSWISLVDETKTQDFFIESNGDLAIVKVEQSYGFRTIFLEKDHQQKSNFIKGVNPKVEQFLRSRGSQSTNILGFNRTMRFYEGVIELDEKIAVMGHAQWKSLSEPIEGFNYSKILTLTGSKAHTLLITDVKKAVVNSK